MYAIEFETNISSRFIEIKDYQRVLNKQAKVIVLVDDESPQDSAEKPGLQQLRALFDKHKQDQPIDAQLDLYAMANEVNG